ncbi:MAG: right-handed parallel beta-helix repeat-containing protein [Lachnospiraceae bacterium]|nr:right-handed parallel beta-helix repeat-containing protein [Lachnospiraceae bacterium]MDD3615944.1 right-handed parallel beta-helix repeat-containing protein [Lachnospiraceae bacterium]
MKYYVNKNAIRSGNGSEEYPFQRIQEAANLAKPGDEVLVYPGVYRENVNPVNAGEEDARITYRSVEPLGAVITGAESVKTWENVQGNVWMAKIANGIFGDYNPFKVLVSGDWYIATIVAHTGDVFLNGKSMYEVTELDKVYNPEINKGSWDSEFTIYTWYTTQDEEKNETILYANFQGKNPNEEDVEISVRENCFYPVEEGVGFITFSGFTVNKAATQWAPPTAYQEGMIGPHWSKGWIIEDCDISESKCSGISLGKYKQEGNDNKWLHWKYKDGTQTERDCICQAQREGWTKENIGHHIVRRCNIHDCGQTGIVGHLGGVFSLIEDNHIHHINNKQNLAGAEIGGIKMHAAIDTIFRRNHIHNCTRGIWLDWQAQGTRVTQNLFHDNVLAGLKDGDTEILPEYSKGLGEDLFIEVSHGPTLVDYNVFLSSRAIKMAAQGIALVHNLIGGSLVSVGIGTDNGAKTMASVRYTPYHVQHRTEVAGFMSILHGDSRFYNNIFVQQEVHPVLRKMEEIMGSDGNGWDDCCVSVGLMCYNGYQTEEEWKKEFEGYCGMGSEPSDRYYMHLPVWAEGNVYYNGAKSWEKENSVEDTEHKIELSLREKDGKWILKTNLYEYLPPYIAGTISTETLGMAFEPEQLFENPDGTPIIFNEDYFGKHCGVNPMAGPFESVAGDEIEVYYS